MWLIFSLPVLLGAFSRKHAFRLMPLLLFTGTAMEMIVPQALMPGIVRFAHFFELGFSMIIVGLFMVWLFLNDKLPDSAKSN